MHNTPLLLGRCNMPNMLPLSEAYGVAICQRWSSLMLIAANLGKMLYNQRLRGAGLRVDGVPVGNGMLGV